MTTSTGPNLQQRTADTVEPSNHERTPQSVFTPYTIPRCRRYMSRGTDRHPPTIPSQVLLFQTTRPGRLISRKSSDQQAEVTYGDSIVHTAPGTTRFTFQNVKGLSFNQSGDNYNYYLSSMLSFLIDVLECWQKLTPASSIHMYKQNSSIAFDAYYKWESQIRVSNSTRGPPWRARNVLCRRFTPSGS